MTPNPKTRKSAANGANLDPVFAAIAEHKALVRKYLRCRSTFQAARDQAEQKHGVRHGVQMNKREHNQFKVRLNAAVGDTRLEYDQFSSAGTAERRAGMRMARTKPTTPQGAAALITHARREIVDSNCEDFDDWVPTALKTVASALTRMSQELA